MRLEVFGKINCAKCKSAKERLAHLLSKDGLAATASLQFFDLDTVEGMAEGAFSDVFQVPTVILRSDEGDVAARWDGKAPLTTEVQAVLGTAKGLSAVQ
jgi:hypothetical protein